MDLNVRDLREIFRVNKSHFMRIKIPADSFAKWLENFKDETESRVALDFVVNKMVPAIRKIEKASETMDEEQWVRYSRIAPRAKFVVIRQRAISLFKEVWRRRPNSKVRRSE